VWSFSLAISWYVSIFFRPPRISTHPDSSLAYYLLSNPPCILRSSAVQHLDARRCHSLGQPYRARHLHQRRLFPQPLLHRHLHFHAAYHFRVPHHTIATSTSTTAKWQSKCAAVSEPRDGRASKHSLATLLLQVFHPVRRGDGYASCMQGV
jgi:hypothetical protein